jgi:hypothetical protein
MSPSTGYTGVFKNRQRFAAQIRVAGKIKSLGTYDTTKEAALVFDRAVIQYKLPKNKLNFPNGLPTDDPNYDTLTNPENFKRRKLAATNTTGFTGVSKNGSRFLARITVDHKQQSLGRFDTPEEAALAYDRAVIRFKKPRASLNYPNGHKKQKTSRKKKSQARKVRSTNTTGYTGVSKNGRRFQAKINVHGSQKSLGTYDTKKEAALAFDRAVIQYKLPKNKLNFPNGLSKNDKDYEKLMNPIKKKRKLSSNNTTGYTGVYKNKKRFQALITIDYKLKSLGTYDTPKEAALAFDRAVIQYKRPRSKLNYPSGFTTSDEEEEEEVDEEEEEEEEEDSAANHAELLMVASIMSTLNKD